MNQATGDSILVAINVVFKDGNENALVLAFIMLVLWVILIIGIYSRGGVK
ncbi:unnamed protein product [marine sediment metagenome]|uniref:Uncharacterized protein n=1 Tax=marine sediment metagenome TaxID=412755 RepID=X0RUB7_9ZZZZ